MTDIDRPRKRKSASIEAAKFKKQKGQTPDKRKTGNSFGEGRSILKATSRPKQEEDDDNLSDVAITTDHEPSKGDDFTRFDSDSSDDGGAILSKDHTADLLKDFESSSESEKEDSATEEPPNRAPVASVPQAPTPKKISSAKASHKMQDDDPPITLYVGRIPHGFYEHQMRAYFSQFGEITHLRLAHNRRTGRSKHYGFLEFSSGEVARIVQQTMDNYLLFGHILQVKQVSPQRLEELRKKGVDLWKGEGKRFRKVPWRDMERGRLKSASREEWEKRINKEKERRSKKAEKLSELGYEFQLPHLRGVESVPVKESRKASSTQDDTNNEI